MKQKFDYVVVGAGFTGSTLAHLIATQLNKTVLVIDRRDHVGGNAADTIDPDSGHQYNLHGPHIFHTDSKKIFEFLSKFTDWTPYVHHVSADLSPNQFDGELFQLPVNFNTIRKLYKFRNAELIIDSLIREYGQDTRVPVLRLMSSDSPGIRDFGDQIWNYFFENYTRRQWGMEPRELDPMVTGRVPVRLSYDDRHFQDHYQYAPLDGYTPLFQRMLSHQNITHLTGVDYHEFDEADGQHLIYTGGIDRFFDYAFGRLPYRSMEIRQIHLPTSNVFPVSTINYPNTSGILRATEQPKITGQMQLNKKISGTFIMTEAPKEYNPADRESEQYYPIPTLDNRDLYNSYVHLAKTEAPHVTFAGRLGSYLYIEMGQAVGHAMSVFENQILPKEMS